MDHKGHKEYTKTTKLTACVNALCQLSERCATLMNFANQQIESVNLPKTGWVLPFLDGFSEPAGQANGKTGIGFIHSAKAQKGGLHRQPFQG
jgi:hypothetical protein